MKGIHEVCAGKTLQLINILLIVCKKVYKDDHILNEEPFCPENLNVISMRVNFQVDQMYPDGRVLETTGFSLADGLNQSN